MALGITASLIGVYSPRTVQIVVTGLTVGVDYEVTGNWSGGSWPVRAGLGTAEAAQVVLSDLSAPINVPVTYKVVHNGVTATSAPVTAAYPHDSVLQSLSGAASVAFELIDNGAPRDLAPRQSAFQIPGRSHPVLRYDISGGESGQWVVDTDGVNTAVLKAMLKTGAPLLLRTTGSVADLEPSEFLSFTGVSSSVMIGSLRRWTLSYIVIDDPEPDELIGLPTWDDFDASYSGLTWTAFDAEWAGSSWSAFDTYDWATRAAS